MLVGRGKERDHLRVAGQHHRDQALLLDHRDERRGGERRRGGGAVGELVRRPALGDPAGREGERDQRRQHRQERERQPRPLRPAAERRRPVPRPCSSSAPSSGRDASADRRP